MIYYITYYILGLGLAALALLMLVSAFVFRRTGKTILGVRLRPNSLEEKRLKRISTNKSVLYLFVNWVLTVLNLSYSIVLIIRFHISGLWIFLVAGPVFILLVTIWVLYVVRDQIITKSKR